MQNLKDEIKKLIREYGVFGDAIIDEITDEIIKVVEKDYGKSHQRKLWKSDNT